MPHGTASLFTSTCLLSEYTTSSFSRLQQFQFPKVPHEKKNHSRDAHIRPPIPFSLPLPCRGGRQYPRTRQAPPLGPRGAQHLLDERQVRAVPHLYPGMVRQNQQPSAQ